MKVQDCDGDEITVEVIRGRVILSNVSTEGTNIVFSVEQTHNLIEALVAAANEAALHRALYEGKTK
jgi:hypothetical protein